MLYSIAVNLLQKAHSGAITSIRYRRDGLEFYSMGEDGRIRRWMTDLSRSSFGSEPLICTLNYGKKSKKGGNLAMDISADTDLPIAFAPSGSSIKVCDMKDCRVRKELLGHFKQVNCFAYDSQYQIGYSGGNDAAVMVWSGHTTPEQTYLEDKITGEGSGADVSGRRKRNQGQLINLCDDDDFEEEYEVPSSSSSDEDIEGLRT
jgi:WD40 repeat protein